MIDNYKDKKLVDYLEIGQKVLIRFGHGLGDTLMFIPVLNKLETLFPDIKFDIYVESGQEEIFGTCPDKEGNGYDLVFHLDYRMAEGSGMTKNEKCWVEEIGLPLELLDGCPDVIPVLPKKTSPLVAVHFQGTALPGAVNCPPEIAHKIWNEIIESGKIPIECHFEHCWHNSTNIKYPFITNTVRDCKADLHNLIGLLQHCFAFIGVASGPWVMAMSIMPERTFYLERNHPLESYTTMNIERCHVNNYYGGEILRWLNKL